MITLALDAATYVGTVAVLDGARVLSEASVAMRGADEERLMPAVAESLRRADLAVGAIGRVVCGAGPGSFTSLRIAASIAKGISTGIGCPLYAVPSLGLVVAGSATRAGRYAAVVDALRGEVYVGVYEVTGGAVRELSPARVIAAEDLPIFAATDGGGAVLVGPAQGGRGPHARDAPALEELIRARGPVDLASWEPDYGRLAEAQVRWEAAHGRRLADA
jgi:tRNA threonylcarbamoyladenosine biosynthesis protein TsaB